MNRFRRFQLSKPFVVTIVFSISLLLLVWFGSSLLPTLAKSETRVFNEVWQTVNDNFYDAKFNGVDWKAMRQKYQPQVEKAKSNQEVASVINQMLAELRTSHTRFYTQNESAYYQLLGIFQPLSGELKQRFQKVFPKGKIEYTSIGVFTKDINGKTFVSAILDDSPAAKAGLKVGDQLVSIDGSPYQQIQSFQDKAGKTVKLLIQRSPNSNTQQEIAIAPKIFDATTMFLDAQKASTQVIEQQGTKIGYVHIWSYAGQQYQQQLEQDLFYGRLRNAEGLVLDLREGWGGASPNYLNIYTAEGPSITSIRRDGQPRTVNYQWKKPVVMVVNEGSRSGKEILAYGFQQYKIGPVVGFKTPGAVVAGSPFLMEDGSLLYLAVADVWLNEKQRLEGKGITPDINVPFSLEYANGADPQKQQAIETVIKSLKQSS
ncbi:MAG: PDZ domain-containing protein [Desmonostoc vinosum HA7617-LM4]|jgi:carboxyl-terminal processing protease|nr:PDZ domain-containing protein [Desmonostoc vinosum HA7617-LM4]